MSYLPEPPQPSAPRARPGDLGAWLRQALLERRETERGPWAYDYSVETVHARLEELWRRRHVTRKLFEPKADLAKECAWLVEQLDAAGGALGMSHVDIQVVQGSLRRRLKFWESDGEL